MKNIEEILHKMKELNPGIKMDEKFRKFLKNKLEVTAYSKIKNTENKKINIAKSGFFSFWKDNSNIFEKPKFNFIKFLSPIFIGSFVVFGFVNFYGVDLFINNKSDFNYKVEKVEQREVYNNNNSPIILFHKEDEQVRSKIKEKQEVKKTIKKIVPDSEIKKITPKINSKKTIIQENKKQINNNTSVNTEIIDLLGNEDVENINNNEENFDMGNAPAMVDSLSMDDGFESNDTVATDSNEIISNNGDFEDFCNSKSGKIENDICIYGEKKCSLEEFINNKCN